MPAEEIMRKFKAGTLKSSSGQRVTNPAQARAIAASYGPKKKRPVVRRHVKKSKQTGMMPASRATPMKSPKPMKGGHAGMGGM